jgi:hypothetical protein
MKAILGFTLTTLLACGLLAAIFTPAPVISAMPAPQMSQPLYCASDDGRRHYCAMNTSYGVQLWRQRSDAACLFGQTWGYDNRGVWVDRGCRAEFVPGNAGGGSGGGNWGGWGQNYNVYCASDDGRRNRCPVDTSRGVTLVRKRSDAPCNYGVSWGYDRNGIWVDRGCRADFQIGQNGWQPPATQSIYCASDNGTRNFCRADTRKGVRIIRQRSDADCIYNRTWGYDQSNIWVDRGCRADFEVGLGR